MWYTYIVHNMATANGDRRKAQRVEWPLSVSYRMTNRPGSKQTAQCVNVSGNGLQMLAAGPLPLHTEVSVELDSQMAEIGILKAVCVVRWYRKAAGQYRVGLKLVNVTPREVWETFLCEAMLQVSLP